MTHWVFLRRLRDDDPLVFERHWWNVFGVKMLTSRAKEGRDSRARLDELVACTSSSAAYAATSPSVTEAQLVTLANDEEHFIRHVPATRACQRLLTSSLMTRDIYVGRA